MTRSSQPPDGRLSSNPPPPPPRALARRKRVGIVLGAGGPVGHAYHAGVLRALQDALGWDVREAEIVVGTSAGAQVGALLRAGMSGRDLAARVAGDPLGEQAHAIARNWVRPCHKTPDPDLPKSRRPASMRFFLEAIRKPKHLISPGRIVSALLPAGRVRLDAQAAGLREVFGDVWPERGLYITSVQLDTGKRVAFGSPGAPSIDVGTAVTCSGAVPGVHAPVHWQGVRYVDGGMASPTHLDLLADRGLDLVLVCSPLSMFGPMRSLLRGEIQRLGRNAPPVVAFEPQGAALGLMGRNPMDLARAAPVALAAYETTLRALKTGWKREVLWKLF